MISRNQHLGNIFNARGPLIVQFWPQSRFETGLPSRPVKSEGENPFDIAHFRSLKYDPNDIELSIENVAEAIGQTLNAEEPDSGVFDALPELPRVS